MSPSRLPWRQLGLTAGIAILVLLAYLAIGAVAIPVPEVIRHLVSGDLGGTDPLNTIVWRIRLPRALACAAVGAILSSVGTCFQALFRNPLAEPYVIGVSSGAAVGGTLAVLVGLDWGLGRMGLAGLGAALSLALVMALANRQGVTNVQTLLVGGVVAGSLLSGLTTLNLALAGQDSGRILFWLLGSTTPMFWDRALVLVAVAVLGSVVLWRLGRGLNALAVNEFTAETQGVDVKRLKLVTLSVGSVMTGLAVGTVGIVGFIGLVAPHVARRIAGIDVRRSLPVSVFIGTSLILAADILAQRLKPGTELPLGAVTAVLGAPALLWLLKKKG